jgi:hypothetical protein
MMVRMIKVSSLVMRIHISLLCKIIESYNHLQLIDVMQSTCFPADMINRKRQVHVAS